MHDPMTVAFEIRVPWYRTVKMGGEKTWRHRPSLITIWHVDPEVCGDDDSCGWTWPKATQADRDLAKDLAKQEFEYWLGKYGQHATGGVPFSAYEIIWWGWQVLANRRRRTAAVLSASELRTILNLAANPHDNIRRLVAGALTIDGMEAFFLCVDRLYRAHHRPWWKHPKWHVRHWSLQIHPWQTFRRWTFSRCAGCGKRFAWGYCPVSTSWDKPRPRWFRSEVGSYHSECAPGGPQASATAAGSSCVH